jgi:hypothetical protein
VVEPLLLYSYLAGSYLILQQLLHWTSAMKMCKSMDTALMAQDTSKIATITGFMAKIKD